MGLVSIITAIKDLDHILFYKLITYNCSKYVEPNSKLNQYMNEKKNIQRRTKKSWIWVKFYKFSDVVEVLFFLDMDLFFFFFVKFRFPLATVWFGHNFCDVSYACRFWWLRFRLPKSVFVFAWDSFNSFTFSVTWLYGLTGILFILQRFFFEELFCKDYSFVEKWDYSFWFV